MNDPPLPTGPTDTPLAREVEPIVEPAPLSARDINFKRVPAVVLWRDPSGGHHRLEDLRFTITYTVGSPYATTLNLSATARVRNSSAKTGFFLFIKPEHIQSLWCVQSRDNDEGQEEQRQQAQASLGTPAHTLRFKMSQRLLFVVPRDCQFASFRANSQKMWESMKGFARVTASTCFDVHFPVSDVTLRDLELFCHAVSDGTFRWDGGVVYSLYRGKGGRKVDLDETDTDDAAAGPSGVGVADDAAVPPPTYNSLVDVGSSSAPPLLLSPQPDAPRSLKRRRVLSSSPDLDAGDRPPTDTTGDTRAILVDILGRLKRIEDRLDGLEERQDNAVAGIVEELEEHIQPALEPFREEMDSRLLDAEVKDEEAIRDIASDVMGEFVNNNLEQIVADYLSDIIQDAVQETLEDTIRATVEGTIWATVQSTIREHGTTPGRR